MSSASGMLLGMDEITQKVPQDDEEERKFNADQLLELQILRAEQKDRMRKDYELKQLEIEKANKKKQKQ